MLIVPPLLAELPRDHLHERARLQGRRRQRATSWTAVQFAARWFRRRLCSVFLAQLGREGFTAQAAACELRLRSSLTVDLHASTEDFSDADTGHLSSPVLPAVAPTHVVML